MNLWPKRTSTEIATTGRTPRERARRAKEIRAIEKDTANWLRGGGLVRRKGW